ncbi:MAG: hypothetical protein HGB31_00485 [Erysipelotrichaceae bacterium]|nr:hypothetical protein [Erysipelotrichaceae bacterium]
MKRIEKIINRHGLDLFKLKSTKVLIDYYKKTVKDNQNINLKIKSELDFFNAAILIESLKNKSLFEEAYERERKELTDLWPTLSYQEKNKLINIKINDVKKRCKMFTSLSGTRIWIAFFDELLNTLYDKEMNIFDLEQYFNLYKNFKSRMISTTQYGIAPFRDEFIDVKLIQSDENRVIFFYDATKSLFLLKTNEPIWILKKLCLNKEYQLHFDDYAKFIRIMDDLETNQTLPFIDELIDSTFISDRVNKALIKLKRKMQ